MYLPIPGLTRLVAFVPDPPAHPEPAPSSSLDDAAWVTAERTARARLLVALETAGGKRPLRGLSRANFSPEVIAMLKIYASSGRLAGARLTSVHVMPGTGGTLEATCTFELPKRSAAAIALIDNERLTHFEIVDQPLGVRP